MRKQITILGLVVILNILLSLTFLSAWEFDNVKSFNEREDKITIDNAFGFGSTLAEYWLTYNTNECLIDCKAEGNATLYQKDYLFQDTDFVDKHKRKKDLPFEIYYYDMDKTKEVEVLTYETICENFESNGSGPYKVCNEVINGSYNISVPNTKWKSYNPIKRLNPGNYSWKITAKKNKESDIDWSVGMFGISTDEIREHWAWWNSSWKFKRQYNITETLDLNNNQNRSEQWNEVVSGLTGTINCTNEIRVLDSTELIEIPSYAIHVNGTACDIFFRHVKNDTTTNTIYYIYYNNSDAAYPSYSTNLSIGGNQVTNVNYNVSYHTGTLGSTHNEDWFYDNIEMEGVNSGIITAGASLGLFQTPLTPTNGEDWFYNITISNPIFIRLRFGSIDNQGFYNMTFFHDVDQWKLDSFESFSTANSGFRTIYRLGAGKDKCIYYRTGNDSYTRNCGEVVASALTLDSYFDYNINGENKSIFTTWTNSSSDPSDDFSMWGYLRDADGGDPQQAFHSTGSATAAISNINTWNNLYNGYVSNNNDTREEKFWTLRTPPNSSLGVESFTATAPLVSLSVPTEGQSITISSVTFNCSAIDDSILLNISLFIDNVINTTVINTTSGQTFISLETIESVPDGIHNYTCIAADDSLAGTTVTRNFTVDTSPPLLNITFPLNQSYADGYVFVNNTNLTFTWEVSDLNLNTCSYLIDREFFCYQDFANISTCGGDGLGNYLVNGSWIDFPLRNIYDGDFTTWSRSNQPPVATILINYTKPPNSTSAMWDTRDQDWVNLTIPDSCMNRTDLELRIIHKRPVPAYENNYYCLNDTDNWVLLSNRTGSGEIYEEAIYWNITGIPVNCTDNNVTVNVNYTSHSFSFFVNDTTNNINTSTVNFIQTYAFQEINKTYNTTGVESVNETFILYGYYDPIYYPTISGVFTHSANAKATTQTINGNVVKYNSTFGLDLIPVVNATYSQTFYWNITVNNGTSTSYLSNLTNQTINYLNWSHCNLGDGAAYLNITYLIETNNSRVLGEIDASTWVYFSGDSTINRTYVFSNTTPNDQYRFCLTPSYLPVTVDPIIQYSGNGYPQRQSDIVSTTYTNSTANLTLYLLPTASGIYSSIQTAEASNAIISGVTLKVERQIGLTYVTIETGLTDGSGVATFWLNPSFTHRITASKTGYTTTQVSIQPSQSIYTLVMSKVGAADSSYNGSFIGMIWKTYPPPGFLNTGNTTFNFNLSTIMNNLEDCKFEIYSFTTNTTLGSTSGGANLNGCNMSLTIELNGSFHVIGKGWIDTNETSGFTVLFSDQAWRGRDVNSSAWTTLESFIVELRDFPEFGTDESKRQFSRIVFFFLALTILIGVFTFMSGYDLTNPGGALILVLILIAPFSYANWFYMDFGSAQTFEWFKTHWLMFWLILMTSGWWLNNWGRY